MTYKETHDAEKAEIRVRQEELRIIEVFYNFVKAHPEIVSCEANRAILRHYFAGSEKDISAGTLEEALGHPALRAQLAFQSEQREREKLTAFIMKSRSQNQSESAAEHDEARFLNPKATDITTLRQINENILAKRELQSKSVEELREIIKRPDGRPEDLPENISRNQILHMMDAAALRHLLARY